MASMPASAEVNAAANRNPQLPRLPAVAKLTPEYADASRQAMNSNAKPSWAIGASMGGDPESTMARSAWPGAASPSGSDAASVSAMVCNPGERYGSTTPSMRVVPSDTVGLPTRSGEQRPAMQVP